MAFFLNLIFSTIYCITYMMLVRRKCTVMKPQHIVHQMAFSMLLPLKLMILRNLRLVVQHHDVIFFSYIIIQPPFSAFHLSALASRVLFSAIRVIRPKSASCSQTHTSPALACPVNVQFLKPVIYVNWHVNRHQRAGTGNRGEVVMAIGWLAVLTLKHRVKRCFYPLIQRTGDTLT